MMRTVHNVQIKTNESKKKIKNERAFSIHNNKLGKFVYISFFCVMATLFGRLDFLGSMSPSSAALAGTLAWRGPVFYPVCLFSFVGYLSNGFENGVRKYIISTAIMAVLGFVLEKRLKEWDNFKRALFPTICVFIGSASDIIFNEISVYNVFKPFAEAVITMALAMLFDKGTGFIELLANSPNLKSAWEKSGCQTSSLAVMLVLITASVSGITVFGIEAKTVISVFLILSAGYCFGMLAVAIGSMLGFVLLICGSADSTFFCMLSTSGLMCGIFGKNGKSSCLGAFAAGCAIPAFYMGVNSGIMTAVSAVLGAAMFIVLPDKFYSSVSDFAESGDKGAAVYIQSSREAAKAQSYSLGTAFRALAEAFEPDTPQFSDSGKKRAEKIIDDSAEKVCGKCTMSSYCWGGKNCETMSAFYSIIGAFDKRGFALEEDIPESFRLYCVKPKKLVESVNSCCTVINSGTAWKERFIKSRGVISEQLYSIAGIIEGIWKSVSFDPVGDHETASKIKGALLKNDVDVKDVLAFRDTSGRLMVTVKRKKCSVGNNDCSGVVLPVLNSVCGEYLIKSQINCKGDNEGLCSITFRQTDRFGYKFGVSSMKREGSGVSGDSFLVEENSKGVLTVAVSDGMGSGEEAQKESSKAIRLLKKFSDAGFDAGVSSNILNTVLLGNGDGEFFTTLDVCCVNMYTGHGKLIKNGGSTAFIIRGSRVTPIRSTSLPIGILGNVEADITEFSLEDGDMLAMITDGVADAATEGDESFVEGIAKKNRRSDPQAFSKAIIDEAVKLQKGLCKDDMLCVCVKIFEKT